jgi:GR25 family glycosyltransferase involved in LPS biosynthesis
MKYASIILSVDGEIFTHTYSRMSDYHLYRQFDAIYCITLKDNIDRQASASRIANQFGIPLQFFRVDKHPKGGRYGCFESHVELIRFLYNRGANKVLIFEDDFIPSPGYSSDAIGDILRFMTIDQDWDYIQLGYLPVQRLHDPSWLWKFPNSERHSKYLYKFGGLLTHAYCVSRKGMSKILEQSHPLLKLDDQHIPHIDIWYNKIFRDTAYCACPILFDQKWCFPTDNVPANPVEAYLIRPMQCNVEKWALLYHISKMPMYAPVMNASYSLILVLMLYSIIIRYS